MRVLIVDNFPGTELGQVGRALEEVSATLDVRRPWRGDPLPDGPGEHAAIVSFGGGQNARDDVNSPWLPGLARLLRAFGEADRAVLGICLGSQLVARAYGADNLIGRPIEIGWRPVEPTEAGRSDPLTSLIGDGAPLFHWHSDSFTLPEAAVHLASSADTPLQAFRIGERVHATQFHFEADRDVVAAWTAAHPADLERAGASWWIDRHEADRETLGREADRVGLEMARAWVRLAAG